MLQTIKLTQLVVVTAPLFLGSHAFHNNVGRSGPSWSKLPNILTGRNDGSYRKPIFSLHETLNTDDDVAGVKSKDDDSDDNTNTKAATNTINERLMAELQEAEETERFGAKGKKMSLVDGYGRTRKTDAEVKAAIAEARDLNGVNPIVAITGSFFAFGVAAALWVATNKLGTFFAGHPPDTEVYFVLRTAQVFRNLVMGMISLASGFFGVTGLGIFGMGVRVAYGVMTGELDPTPIKRKSAPKESVDLGNMMNLMMNKKQGRRGGGRK
mmetsp:Transcript_26498/g.56787  ORF Transcript_26498/g.56787 Transcript_26498/m.56787 type:complete len:268 (-) Transcript_26498:92-895(-)